MTTETLADIGEFGFIDHITERAHVEQGVIKGVGDDAAVLDCGAEEYLLYTTDMLIEGMHFLRTIMSPQEIGRKALACSISDIAAMGGVPTFAVVSTGAPTNTARSFLEGIGEGFNALAKEYHVSLVGGDMTRSNRLVINVALLGKVGKQDVIYRAGAKKGDSIFVTGALGNSFKNRKHLHFTPRVKEAQFLIRQARPNAMIDVSDGLAGDLGHILKQSGVGAVIRAEQIPLAKDATLEQALHDGEDFELLFTVPAEQAEILRRSKRHHFYEIGTINSKKGLYLVDAKGRKREIEPKGFEHF